MSEAEALSQVEQFLRQERAGQRRAEFMAGLRAKAGVKVMLDAPRVTVAAGDDPSKGPADAPVTIVEFSDFQCPYCARVVPTLKQIEQRYGDKVRVVFRDLPLPNHREAPKAAEAATCANEQGRFWALHDLMFQNQQKLAVADLKQHAATAGLDAAKFAECLDSGRHAAEWQQDAADAQSYGVQSTPAFFINGRMVVGAVPLENFTRVIDEELQRAGLPVPPPAPASAPSTSRPETN
jgi:protein-disulfide isomerase